MRNIVWTQIAWAQYTEWQQEDKKMGDILPPPSLMLRGGGFSVKNTIVSR
jgi:hypothetical protein